MFMVMKNIFQVMSLMIKNLPSIVQLFQVTIELVKYIQAQRLEASKREVLKEVKEGLKDARINKDTTKLEAIFNPPVLPPKSDLS